MNGEKKVRGDEIELLPERFSQKQKTPTKANQTNSKKRRQKSPKQQNKPLSINFYRIILSTIHKTHSQTNKPHK